MGEEFEIRNKFLNHVLYEIRMFYYIFVLCDKGIIIFSKDSKDAEGLNDAIFVSFLLHFRNLYYFFNDLKYPKDIKVSTFVEKEEICNYKFDFDIARINKCLSHIATERITYEGVAPFDFKDLFSIISIKCITFFNYLMSHDLASCYKYEIIKLTDEFSKWA
jgi:hypothetical protein